MKKYKHKNFIVVMAFAIAATILPELAHAAAVTGDGALSGGLCALNNFAQGATGKAIATIAVILVGLGAFFGKASWGLVILTAMGIALMFGAGAIATAMGGTGVNCTGVV